jgi:signal-transduction protein with cAMP-binding, CBS, and nucleotidyltransferase domain
MPKAFDAGNPPFDRLTPQEVETLRAALDIAYFRPGEAIIEQDTPADALYVVIRGLPRSSTTIYRASWMNSSATRRSSVTVR